MESRAVITIVSDGEWGVKILTEFHPDVNLGSDGPNPPTHHVAMRMLDAAITMSDDPAAAVENAKFGPRSEAHSDAE